VTSPYIQQGKLGIHDSLPTRRESLSGEAYSQTVILRTGVAMLLRECDYSGVRREAILGSNISFKNQLGYLISSEPSTAQSGILPVVSDLVIFHSKPARLSHIGVAHPFSQVDPGAICILVSLISCAGSTVQYSRRCRSVKLTSPYQKGQACFHDSLPPLARVPLWRGLCPNVIPSG
jgi:hypothetical protein